MTPPQLLPARRPPSHRRRLWTRWVPRSLARTRFWSVVAVHRPQHCCCCPRWRIGASLRHACVRKTRPQTLTLFSNRIIGDLVTPNDSQKLVNRYNIDIKEMRRPLSNLFEVLSTAQHARSFNGQISRSTELPFVCSRSHRRHGRG